MSKRLNVLMILLVLVMLSTGAYAQIAAKAAVATEVSSQAIEKVSDTEFTQVKQVEVRYNYDEMLNAKNALQARLDQAKANEAKIQTSLDEVSAVVSDLEKQGAKPSTAIVSGKRPMSLGDRTRRSASKVHPIEGGAVKVIK